jgi:hypothetical protein
MTIMLSRKITLSLVPYLLSHDQFGRIHKRNPTANENTKLGDQFLLLGLHTIEQRGYPGWDLWFEVQVLKFTVEDLKFTCQVRLLGLGFRF